MNFQWVRNFVEGDRESVGWTENSSTYWACCAFFSALCFVYWCKKGGFLTKKINVSMWRGWLLWRCRSDDGRLNENCVGYLFFIRIHCARVGVLRIGDVDESKVETERAYWWIVSGLLVLCGFVVDNAQFSHQDYKHWAHDEKKEKRIGVPSVCDELEAEFGLGEFLLKKVVVII